MRQPHRLVRWAVTCIALVSLSLLPTCGGGHSQDAPTGPPAFLVFTTGINAFAGDASTGKLRPVSGSPFVPPSVGGNNREAGFEVDPKNRFLIVGVSSSATCCKFAGLEMMTIDQNTGALAAQPTASLQLDEGAAMVDPLGRFIFHSKLGNLVIGTSPTPGIFVETVNADSTLTPVPGSPFRPEGVFREVFLEAVEPSGKFAYAIPRADALTPRQQPSILIFSIDPTGALTETGRVAIPLTISTPFSNPRLLMEPQHGFLYVIDNNFDGNVAPTETTWQAFHVDSTSGSLSAMASGTAPLFDMPITFHPSGNFAYGTVCTLNDSVGLQCSVLGFRVDVQGALIPLREFSLAGGFAVAFDPSGKFAYVSHTPITGISTMQVFNFDLNTGGLIGPIQSLGLSPAARWVAASH